MAIVLLVILFVITWYLLDTFYFKRLKYPAGPAPLPLIGNLHCIDPKDTYNAFSQWKKKYGPIYTCWFGNVPAVVLSDYNVLNEALIKNSDAFGSRFAYGRMTALVRDGYEDVGLLDEGRPEVFQEQRRFFSSFIRSLNSDGIRLEDRIFVEVNDFLAELHSACSESQPVSFVSLIDRSVGSIISSLIFGSRYQKSRILEFQYLKSTINEFLVYISDPLALSVANQRINFAVFPPFRERYKRIERTRNKLFKFMHDKINEREQLKETGGLHENVCLIDAFLQKIHDGVNSKVYNRKMLVNMMFDLFSAGQDTTSHTIAFILLYVLNSPETQLKIHEELDQVISQNRPITSSDRQKLPFFNAVINEGQRLANLIPVNLFQKTLRDVTVCGHQIKAGTCILPQISCVMFDDTVFSEPLEFRPERFLNEDGSLRKILEFIPFSLGRRQCLGENIAGLELFLFLSNMFNQFEILPVDPENPPSTTKTLGMTAQPQPFDIMLKNRWN
ncbi:unnamed protein product [Bursaphelenchus okinawaensis]|uniref:Unspecific monooxygenase n=1 Tax=Bursaphelenchus okinawaensis TaxID=465554 RepID=A0A811KWR4_9BILA|nr:unnamed protein product [Bursaphelenchus okinawaensis]CAG9113431.1 unnamed protein product [Bursaphelenchus okinawaensis]